MPDRPVHAIDRDPLPFRPSAAGCAYSVHVHAGQWGTCGGRPTVSGVWTSPRDGERCLAYACSEHGDRFDGPEWAAVGPLDRSAAAELADRWERWAVALAGRGWRPPAPMEPGRRRGRL